MGCRANSPATSTEAAGVRLHEHCGGALGLEGLLEHPTAPLRLQDDNSCDTICGLALC